MRSRRTLQSGWRWRPRTSPQAGPAKRSGPGSRCRWPPVVGASSVHHSTFALPPPLLLCHGAAAEELATVDQASKLDTTNASQVDLLHRLFSHNMAAVDFWLK